MRCEGLGAGLTKSQAGEVFRRGEEAIVFALLHQAKLWAEWQGKGVPSPNTVSPGAPFDNHPAERAIRPAGIIRKHRPNRRSPRAAPTQGILRSVYRTLKQRGHAPLPTITRAIENCLTTGYWPPLPTSCATIG